MAASISRPGSPYRPSSTISPSQDPITRPSSRCESLLRDTLRRADEHDGYRYRSVSRSPVRWSTDRRVRSRGASVLGSGPRNAAYSECDCDEYIFSCAHGDLRNSLHRTPSAGSNYRELRAIPDSPRSPTSPSRAPPSMVRTLTAPSLPRGSTSLYGDEHACAPYSPPSPLVGRHSLPYSCVGSAGPQSNAHSDAASAESSPKQRYHAISPHESVLRAKLESVLQKASSQTDEPEADVHRRRHHRTFSHNVMNGGSQSHGEYGSNLPSPQSLSNSATDLAKAAAVSYPAYRRHTADKLSLSSPAEPITPPPTPPTMAFNPKAASELCKRIDGYVSFASIEGLGEPPGMDSDDDDEDDGIRRWSKWWRKLPFVHGAHGSEDQDTSTGYTARGRHRSNSAVSR